MAKPLRMVAWIILSLYKYLFDIYIYIYIYAFILQVDQTVQQYICKLALSLVNLNSKTPGVEGPWKEHVLP